MNQHAIRAVRADEWQQVKELRIAALKDPVASIAFLESLAEAEAKPDSHWQDRAAGASHGRSVRQFIAEAPDGRWDGSVTVLIEEAGDSGIFGGAMALNQGHLVGVFVRPGQRGTGLIEALFEAALDWAWSLETPVLERVRLYVHERNDRAAACYRRMGFTPTGEVVPMPGDPSAKELEYAVPRPE
ncbi:GNAT family N-acetyltransferase [Streptomyces venezuelae]|uniref:GNAT family N-acetyltransferase n=1 Tax=Streptomyces venezuelae TaxID=54571 RepID=A0A5P2D1K9_STRVZ|nr:GNAT family N-acetyltransferase [Streptomyces venezuelae]QES48995.1 GNAT family N-acetyltransferase [Streptomyces venezuelae]